MAPPISAYPEPLQTERLTLRRLSPADATALFGTTGDPDVMRYWAPGPDATVSAAKRRIDEIEQHWQTHGFGDWGIEERATGELIGFSGLHYIAGMPEVNVGYAVRRDRWGLGYGTEVCRAALDVGFSTLGLAEVVAVISPENSASKRLAEKCGLVYWKELDWLGRPRVVYRVTYAQYVAGSAEVVTASAYVAWRGRYVFMVGFPGDARDRLGVVRLGGHREEGEGAWECAAREGMEESGLRIRPIVPPATYWFGAEQDERSMVAAPWPDTLEGGLAPLLVGWRPDPNRGTGRRMSVTYLTEGRGTPVPESETQGLLLLRPEHVRAIAANRLTLGAILDQGAEALLHTPFPTELPLVPLTQLRALAILLDRHPELSAC